MTERRMGNICWSVCNRWLRRMRYETSVQQCSCFLGKIKTTLKSLEHQLLSYKHQTGISWKTAQCCQNRDPSSTLYSQSNSCVLSPNFGNTFSCFSPSLSVSQTSASCSEISQLRVAYKPKTSQPRLASLHRQLWPSSLGYSAVCTDSEVQQRCNRPALSKLCRNKL